MNTNETVAMIERMAQTWSGQGEIVECGSWLGGSAQALIRGLAGRPYDREIHLFDYFRCRNNTESEKASVQGVDLEPGQETLSFVRDALDPTGYRIAYHVGDVRRAHWPSTTPIEIFLLDTAKRGSAFNKTLAAFSPAWIPGVTQVGLLDYYYYLKIACPGRAEDFRHQEKFITRNKQSFELIEHHGSAAWFQYIKPMGQ